ncbi:Imm30 family immunity protein [Brevundimonas nasdae]|uniref:Imm30 family immunity protein n=1 Tax=Brevundimonas nasdae TaxID=172043 RepID=UPI0028994EF2|nr:Imm30 family immunity protein [Brevundimonas nasdae]
MYDSELQALRREIETGGARPSVIDDHVDALLTEGRATLAEDLLASLSDKAEYDEGMFSIIHAAESVDDTPYVSALLAAFPALSASSPRWASIVLMRVLNSSQAQHELVRQLRDASAPIKESVRAMCERINEVSPEFLSKTVPVTLAAA